MYGKKGPNGFVVDEMLIKLGRFLRISGYLVLIPRGRSDKEIASIAIREELILLTRDKDLSNMKGPNSIRIVSDRIEEQMKELQISNSLNSVMRTTSRCPECCSVLDITDDPERIDLLDVPPKVKEGQTLFFICPECDKVYWKGNHWDGIMNILKETGSEPLPYR